MPVMIITYDVQDNERRAEIRERIEKMQPTKGLRFMISQSAYVVATNQNERVMFESLKPLTQNGDKLSVVALTAPGYALSPIAQGKLKEFLRG